MSVASQEETVCESANNARTFTILRRADASVAPLVSVVVPVFNASSTLEEALLLDYEPNARRHRDRLRE